MNPDKRKEIDDIVSKLDQKIESMRILLHNNELIKGLCKILGKIDGEDRYRAPLLKFYEENKNSNFEASDDPLGDRALLAEIKNLYILTEEQDQLLEEWRSLNKEIYDLTGGLTRLINEE